MRKPGIVNTIKGFLGLLWATVFAFFSDGCSTMAAALSFNTFLSLPALLTLILSLVGRFTDPQRVQGAIVGEVSDLIGTAGASQVAAIIGNASRSQEAASIATIVSLIVLILGATGLFAGLQNALNKAWGVKPDPKRNQIRVFRSEAASIATIVSLIVLILGATGLFAGLQNALNKAWGVKPDPKRNQIRVFLLKRVFSFGILITVA